MAKYDGPSFYRKDNPKIQSLQKDTSADKKRLEKYALPKNIRTQADLKDEARQYMQTPTNSIQQDPPPERFPFKNKHIPMSLQHLDGWKNQDANQKRYATIQARLEKEPSSYLLFEDPHAGEMIEAEEETNRLPVHTKKVSLNRDLENGTPTQKEMTENLMKSGSGLNRSLSNIIAEEQKGILKSQHKLNRLFNEKK